MVPALAVFASLNRNLAHANDRELNLLSNGAVESFWDALWLELWMLFVFQVKDLVES